MPDATPMKSQLSAGQRLLRRLVLVEPGEFGPMVWSAAYFFFLLFGYYILRPLRDEIGASGGIEKLPWLFTGTMLAMLAVNPLFAWMVSRLPRRRFIPITYHFFALNIAAFFVLMKFGPESWQLYVGRAFYIWTSVFNLFAVTVFWGFMADVFRREQGVRIFGFIAIGGTLGSICGSSLVSTMAKRVGSLNLLGVSILMLELAVVCVSVLVWRYGLGRSDAAHPTEPGEKSLVPSDSIGRGVFNGVLLLARSPYMLGICLYMLLYTMTSTYLYFEQAAITKEHFADPDARRAFLASIDLWTNVLTLTVQVFATGRIVRRIGVAATLGVLPILTAVGFSSLAAAGEIASALNTILAVVGFSALAISPAAVFAVVQVTRRGLHYAIDRPARETLYTVLSREEKYKSKSFIDTFVYRGGDQIAAWSRGPLAGLGTLTMALVFVGMSLVWGVTGVMLGRKQRAIAQIQESAPPA